MSELHDTLRRMRDELTAKREALEAELAPVRAEREALVAKIQPLEADLRAVDARIKAAEPPIRKIAQELAEIARVLGAKTLRNG